MVDKQQWDGTLEGILAHAEIDDKLTWREVLDNDLEVPDLDAESICEAVEFRGFQPRRIVGLADGTKWKEYTYPEHIDISGAISGMPSKKGGLAAYVKCEPKPDASAPRSHAGKLALRVFSQNQLPGTARIYHMSGFFAERKQIVKAASHLYNGRGWAAISYSKTIAALVAAVSAPYIGFVSQIDAPAVAEYLGGVAIIIGSGAVAYHFHHREETRTIRKYDDLRKRDRIVTGRVAMDVLRVLPTYLPIQRPHENDDMKHSKRTPIIAGYNLDRTRDSSRRLQVSGRHSQSRLAPLKDQ